MMEQKVVLICTSGRPWAARAGWYGPTEVFSFVRFRQPRYTQSHTFSLEKADEG